MGPLFSSPPPPPSKFRMTAVANGATRVSLTTSMSQPETPPMPIKSPRTTLSTVPPRPMTNLPLNRLLLTPVRPPPRLLLLLPRLIPLLLSLVLVTRPQHTQERRPPRTPPSPPRREPSMPILRLSIPKLKRTLLRPESKEILMPPPLPRPLLMPSSLPTMPELHGRRISSREVRTRTDLRKSTRTPLPRPPKLTASTTREREPTADSSRPLLPSEYVLFEFNAKINKVK